MEVEILGAHSAEIADARLPAILIDEVLALDAGSLCSSLPLSSQQKLKAILLSHYHYDHVRDIPMIAMNISQQTVIDIFSIPIVFEVLSTHLLDGVMYPNFLESPVEQPAIRFTSMEPYDRTNIAGYSVKAIPVPHSVPTVGFQVTSPEGKKLFYTSDTGPGLSASWEYTSPDLLITEMSLPNRMEDWARKVAHLTPQLLKEELLQFRKSKGYIPTTILIHINPTLESEIKKEVALVAEELDANITMGREGMVFHL